MSSTSIRLPGEHHHRATLGPAQYQPLTVLRWEQVHPHRMGQHRFGRSVPRFGRSAFGLLT